MRNSASVFGKLLGAIVGFAVGLLLQGWILAIVFTAVGVFIGHRYDELHAAPESLPDAELGGLPPSTARVDPSAPSLGALPSPKTRDEIDGEARASFARHVSTLFAELARVDGEIVRDEVRIVREFFEREMRFTRLELELVRAALKEALAQPGDLESALEECVTEMRPSERLLLLNALYELALADGEMRRSERELLNRIVRGLQISSEDERSIAALHLGDGAEAYERLGVDSGAPDEELRSAYRRLAAANHPDKVAHLGPGAVELASRRFREIREAWDEIRRLRGL